MRIKVGLQKQAFQLPAASGTANMLQLLERIEKDLSFSSRSQGREMFAFGSIGLPMNLNSAREEKIDYRAQRIQALNALTTEPTRENLRDAISDDCFSAFKRFIKQVPQMINQLPQDDAIEHTLLTWAVFCARDKDYKFVRLLLNAGAKINVHYQSLCETRSALSIAVRQADDQLCAYLLSQGADPLIEIVSFGEKRNIIEYASHMKDIFLRDHTAAVRKLLPALIRAGMSLEKLKETRAKTLNVWPAEVVDLDVYFNKIMQQKHIGNMQLIPLDNSNTQLIPWQFSQSKCNLFARVSHATATSTRELANAVDTVAEASFDSEFEKIESDPDYELVSQDEVSEIRRLSPSV